MTTKHESKFVQITALSNAIGAPKLFALDCEGTVWEQRWVDSKNYYLWHKLTMTRKED